MSELSIMQGGGDATKNPEWTRSNWLAFYHDYDHLIVRILRSRRIRGADLDDCRQEVWVEVVSARHAKGTVVDLQGWVATLARNKAVDLLRRKARRPVISLQSVGEGPGDLSGPPRALEADEARSRVWPALAELDRMVGPAAFLAFFLHWFERWPTREIADLLGMSPGQARVRLHRIKRRFGEILRDLEQAEPEA